MSAATYPATRPLQAFVDLAAMAHNLEQARARAGARPIWAVVKANAYGHGIENAVRAFAAADGLALLETGEAQRARAAGWRKPILLLEGVFDARDLAAVEALELTVVVHCIEQVALLESRRDPRTVPVYLKIDTGMHRLGLTAAGLAAARARLAALANVRVIALMTHLANADRAGGAGADRARDAGAGDTGGEGVDGSVSRLGAHGTAVPTLDLQHAALRALGAGWTGGWSVSNSAALFLHEARVHEWVRPGIVLYGASPAAGVRADALGLKPAMCLQARVLAVREVAAGEHVGYGSLWTARRRSRIGVVACGYADGYPRAAPEGTPVWVGGRRAPLVGRVSMDMLTVDLSEVDAAAVGSAVELWGPHVPVDEVAERVGTVGYELLSRLPARVGEGAAWA